MRLSKFLCAAFIAATAVACNTGSGTPEIPDTQVSGILVLNNGNWNSSDASISIYDPGSGSVSSKVFLKQNGRNLGDLGQDIMPYGEDIYIAMNGSQLIYVTDRDLRLKKVIEASLGEYKLSPRSLTAGGGKVYVSYYEGYLGEIDPVSYQVRTTPVGPNPEGIVYVAGNVYVANSGGYLPGYCNTVSMVNAAAFKELATITVNCNPAALVANSDGSLIYVTSIGNYADIPPMLQVIDVATSKVSDLDYPDVKSIAMGKDDTLLVVTGGYDPKTWQIEGTIWKHDAAQNVACGKFSDEHISPYYSISADPESGYAFVGTSDYSTNGDVYLFDASGKKIADFDAQGLNPQKCLYLR